MHFVDLDQISEVVFILHNFKTDLVRLYNILTNKMLAKAEKNVWRTKIRLAYMFVWWRSTCESWKIGKVQRSSSHQTDQSKLFCATNGSSKPPWSQTLDRVRLFQALQRPLSFKNIVFVNTSYFWQCMFHWYILLQCLFYQLIQIVLFLFKIYHMVSFQLRKMWVVKYFCMSI